MMAIILHASFFSIIKGLAIYEQCSYITAQYKSRKRNLTVFRRNGQPPDLGGLSGLARTTRAEARLMDTTYHKRAEVQEKSRIRGAARRRPLGYAEARKVNDHGPEVR
jgi:hypothetical protein